MNKIINKIRIKRLLNKAAIEFQKNRFSDAAPLYEKVLELDRDNFDANLWIGSLFVEMQKFVSATEHLERAIEINPKNIESYFNLALMEARLMRYDKAVKIFEKGLRACTVGKSRIAEIYYNIGALKIREEKYGDAIEYGNKALQLYPKYIQAEQLIIDAYQRMKN